ncbi:MAG: hypothetical protein EXQ48_03400 [Acidobacteria bacterium]|nr:hypothetical protein [Acidobacteriota bacterium]
MATRLTTILVIVIVGATLIAGLIVGAQRDDASGPVDLIIVNGEVYPGGGADFQEAVAVRGNKILRVGSNREVKRLRRAQTVVLDAHGGTVIPGLNDGHVQLMAGALSLDQVDLSTAITIDDLETELRQHAAGLKDAPARLWVVGRNADAALLATANAAARKILDEAVDDRPVFITAADGHVAWADSEALEQAGVNRRTRNTEFGTVVKDRRTGEPTGVLRNAAIEQVARLIPQPTRSDKIVALRAAIAEAHRLGVTSLQSVSPTDEELQLLGEIREHGDLTLRVSGSIAVPATIDEPDVAGLDKLRQKYPDDPTLKMGGIEIVCEKRSSARLVSSTCDPATLDRAVTLLDKHNWQVMVRTTNGADVHAAVDAFEHAAAVNPAPPRHRRYRLDDSLLSDGNARLLFGSGWPAASLDPREAIEQALTSSTELQFAVDAYTSHAAYATYDEQRKGTLAPGMLADIVILSNNIFDHRPGTLQETAVTVTIFDGKIVYQRPSSSSDD